MERHSRSLVLSLPGPRLCRYYILLHANLDQRLPPTLQLRRRTNGRLPRRPTRSPHVICLEQHRHVHLLYSMGNLFGPQQRDWLQSRRLRRHNLCLRRILPLRYRLDSLTPRVPHRNLSLLASLEGASRRDDVRLWITYHCIVLQPDRNGEFGMEVLYCVLCLPYGDLGHGLFLFSGDKGSYARRDCRYF